ncbi:T9SS type A sorting domain-containing protein [Bizionia sp. M204]|nr:T9SS type A sorting domain-containing protein [Bizionia sp. M204]
MSLIKPTSQFTFIMFFCMMFLFASFSNAQTTTAIPDSNFEQALINQGIDTNGLTGNILNSDAELVNNLNINDKNISDLTGIEAFIHLKYLNAYFNNLSTLDLSNNAFLEVLDIDNNSIETLNISQNLLLKEIYVSNNLLQTLTVSHLPNLELLACSLNNLSTLNVSNNLELEVLSCYSNNLNTLNVTNNQELESLNCGTNNLNVLNISSNHDLRSLLCSGNNLNTISFSQCSDITYVDISNNQFTELDLSANSGLKRLICENNNIAELELFNAPQLFLLHASNNLLEDIDISTNNDLRFVRLGNNNLNTLDIRNTRNHRISSFNAEGNANLTCIFVDDVQASYLANWIIDSASHFVANETDCNSLSREEVAQNLDILLYPNPATDYLYIKNLNSNAHIDIYSVNGKLVKQQTTTPQVNSINISSLSSGLYVVKVSYLNQSITKKILIN